jgi:hypothetical protein
LAGSTEGLVVGALVSIALIARDVMTAGRSPKILEIGTAALFCALALYAMFGTPTWSVIGVRLCVDTGYDPPVVVTDCHEVAHCYT